MKVTVKYAVEPVFEKIEKENVKLLYGYIVSKCYELDTDKGHVVLFPFVLNKRTYALNEKRTPNQIIKDFNTTNVDKVFNEYDSARVECDIKNIRLASCRNMHWFKSLDALEKLVTDNTNDMKINEKISIRSKKLVR